MKQGGDTNTIDVVNGIRGALQHLFDVPKNLITKVVFDQSVFVKTAIETLLHEGAIGLLLTSIMILIFLGSMRATVAVFFSIPLSALAAFIALSLGGGTINSMVLGGLALAFSRLIDNSVVVLENIYRHMELGESPAVAAELGNLARLPFERRNQSEVVEHRRTQQQRHVAHHADGILHLVFDPGGFFRHGFQLALANQRGEIGHLHQYSRE